MRSICVHVARGTVYTVIGAARLSKSLPSIVKEDTLVRLACGTGADRLVLVGLDDAYLTGMGNLSTIRAASTLVRGRAVCVYVGEYGDLWARDYEEFMDGRFRFPSDDLQEPVPDDIVHEFLSHGHARTGANSSRIRSMARMIVRLGTDLVRERQSR